MATGHPKGELYFIAVVPPSPVREEAWAVKEELSEKYRTKAALKSPPHITLHMPFRMKEEKEENLITSLTQAVYPAESFDLELKGFGAFPPGVIYLEVPASTPLTGLFHMIRKSMQRFLHSANADWKNRGFTPHLTVAFRDLKKSDFREAWKEYRNRSFEACWEVDAVMLLKHTGKHWEEYREIPLVKR